VCNSYSTSDGGWWLCYACKGKPLGRKFYLGLWHTTLQDLTIGIESECSNTTLHSNEWWSQITKKVHRYHGYKTKSERETNSLILMINIGYKNATLRYKCRFTRVWRILNSTLFVSPVDMIKKTIGTSTDFGHKTGLSYYNRWSKWKQKVEVKR